MTDIYFNEMIKKQLNNIPSIDKLQTNDIKRISKRLNGSIFNDNECSLFDGYIKKNINNNYAFINFYFRKKKVALHRLLYKNFVDNLNNNEFILFSCTNRSNCCNINHMNKSEFKNIQTVCECGSKYLHPSNYKRHIDSKKHKLFFDNDYYDENNDRSFKNLEFRTKNPDYYINYYNNNKDKINEKKNNEKKINKQIKCECGISFTHSNKIRHLSSKRHTEYEFLIKDLSFELDFNNI